MKIVPGSAIEAVTEELGRGYEVLASGVAASQRFGAKGDVLTPRDRLTSPSRLVLAMKATQAPTNMTTAPPARIRTCGDIAVATTTPVRMRHTPRKPATAASSAFDDEDIPRSMPAPQTTPSMWGLLKDSTTRNRCSDNLKPQNQKPSDVAEHTGVSRSRETQAHVPDVSDLTSSIILRHTLNNLQCEYYKIP